MAKLIIVVSTATEAMPVADYVVRVFGEDGALVTEQTVGEAALGRSDPIELPAPPPETSLNPDTRTRPYSLYDVTVRAEGYYAVRVEAVRMFGDEQADLPVGLIPLPGEATDPDGFDTIVYPGQVGGLYDGTEPRESTPPPDMRILSSVYIPSRIRVHLGRPGSNADTVSVSFPDYIKNVASSEIYPTWPEESLRANIYAQISLALNRLYTEWYPSRGYDYDITNSTAFDQYFVYGRNIFDSISKIVDEIFNIYIRKPGRAEPFYAEYCNGTTVTCPGMSQWGTVTLANQGLNARQILTRYYGTIELVTAGDVRGLTGSYPGVLRPGTTSSAVRTIQTQLNRIAINYPAIGTTYADGVYGAQTEQMVRRFQSIFNLTQDGIVGKSTWYRISYIYTAVKKLAELTSEGQEPEYDVGPYGGNLLNIGSSGPAVKKMQFYLSRIATFNPAVPAPVVDGIYGAGTADSVRSFQKAYDLQPDGVIGPNTWDAIESLYTGSLKADDPKGSVDVRPYPGTPIRYGSWGDDVVCVQKMLNAVDSEFPVIPRVTVDGAFGSATQRAVQSFQSTFGLTADGVVGPATWNGLSKMYAAVSSGCTENAPAPADQMDYPGVLLKNGSTGPFVSYIQQRLDEIAVVVATIPTLAADGRFGARTQGAVVAFQSTFGLAADGIVGPATWRKINSVYNAVLNGCLEPLT